MRRREDGREIVAGLGLDREAALLVERDLERPAAAGEHVDRHQHRDRDDRDRAELRQPAEPPARRRRGGLVRRFRRRRRLGRLVRRIHHAGPRLHPDASRLASDGRQLPLPGADAAGSDTFVPPIRYQPSAAPVAAPTRAPLRGAAAAARLGSAGPREEPRHDPDEPADPPHRAAAGDGGAALARRARLPAGAAADQPQPGRAGRAAARAPARGDGRDGARRGRHPPLRPGARACRRCARRSPGAGARPTAATSAPTRWRSPPAATRPSAPSITTLAAPGEAVMLPVPWYFNHKMWLDMAGIEAVPLPCGPDMLPDPSRGAGADGPAGPRHRAGHPEQPHRRGISARARSPSSPRSPASTARC